MADQGWGGWLNRRGTKRLVVYQGRIALLCVSKLRAGTRQACSITPHKESRTLEHICGVVFSFQIEFKVIIVSSPDLLAY